MDPPDPIPNSEVKRLCANDSVGLAHAKVGHRQASFLLRGVVLNLKLRPFFIYKNYF